MFPYVYPNDSILGKTLYRYQDNLTMATTITLPPTSSTERTRLLAVESIRRRALERLYERKEAVLNLIQALEAYQESREERLAQCVSFAVSRTSPSDFSRSQI